MELLTVTPHPFVWLILGLAAYRLTRLGGWDEFPLAARIRAWVIGERWVATVEIDESLEYQFPRPEMQEIGRSAEELGLPGKQPASEAAEVRPAYDRPTLAHLVHCPFCLGWYISLLVYLLWLWQPHWTTVVLAPFALSGFVGLVAKNLDA